MPRVLKLVIVQRMSAANANRICSAFPLAPRADALHSLLGLLLLRPAR